MATYLKPPSLFGIVQPGIYRSNAPQEENLEFFARLNLRTVLYLSPEVLLRGVVDFFERMNVKVHNLGLQAWKPEPNWTPICDEFIKDALEMLLDSSSHPVLVCCTSGVLQTAPLVGCLRRVQRWSLTGILEEYRAFAGSRARLLHEQYIEFFDVDLVVLPEQVPSWLVNYDLIDEREEDARIIQLEKELQQLTEKDEVLVTAEERVRMRRIQFALRCREAQFSTKLVKDTSACTKQSLVDDDDDD